MQRRLGFVVLLCFLGIHCLGQADEPEANLKAAFIYNFTNYIEWENNTDDDFIIGVIGNTPVTASLNQIAKTNSVHNKRIIVKVFPRPEDISYSNILFISKNIHSSISSILNRVGRGVLTVSEQDGYAKLGTALNFVIGPDNKLRFEANLNAIYLSGLRVSSQLLKLAIITD